MLEDAQQTTRGRMERQHLNGFDIERAQHAEREASVAAETEQRALAQAVASAAAGATAAPSPSHP